MSDLRAGPTSTATEEPLPAPESPPDHIRLPPGQWVHENLFNTWYNAVLTVVFSVVLAYAAYRAARFVFITARWEVIEANLTNFMVGRFDRGELYRVWTATYLGAFVLGLGNGFGRRVRSMGGWGEAARRAGPILGGLVVMLAFTRSVLPAVLAVAGFAIAFAGWFLGRRLPQSIGRRLPFAYVATAFLAYAAFTAFGGVGFENWGGVLLAVFAAAAGIVLSFPFGVLLALGRRSSFPAVRMICVGYIEIFRGVPLVTLLFIGALVLGFFLPPGTPRPSLVTRGIIAIILFTAAYIAEIVRGGLQSVPKGQVEAAQSIGLSPITTTYRIVLPQALRNVIPAIVGQFISLFKDTSLLAILGLLEILGVAQIITSQGEFFGQGLQAETLVFAGFLYWVFCYTMSRASQRLETRLGVGTR